MIHWQVRVVCLYTAPSQLNLEILLDVPCQCISIAVPTYTGSSTYLGTATTVLLRRCFYCGYLARPGLTRIHLDHDKQEDTG